MTDWAYGFDFDTKKLAMSVAANGMLPGDSMMHATFVVDFETLRGPERLGRAYQLVFLNVRAQAMQRPCEAAFVEQPSGPPHRIHPETRAMWGVVRAAVWCGLSDVYLSPVTVFDITPSEWKKESVGWGNASKEQILVWAVDQGYDAEMGQDGADSLGIAVAGLRMLRVGA